jgi:hypothetical protein
MPFGKWENFDACVKDFVSQGKNEEQAKRICGALQTRLERSTEGLILSWEGDIAANEGNLIGGKAIHPIKTFHPEEWPSVRVYLEEELRRASGSMAGAPLLLDHMYPVGGEVLDAWYADGAIEYVAELDDSKVLGWISDGTIKHCSVEYEWDNLKKINGVAPQGIKFTGLALLKNYEPGDPEATVQVWEAIVKRLRKSSSVAKKDETIERTESAENLNSTEQAIVRLQEKMEVSYRDLSNRVETLERLVKVKGSLGEAVIDPSASQDDEMVRREEVLSGLKQACYERVPRHWSYGAYLQNRRLKDLIRKLESPSHGEDEAGD